MQGVCFHGTPFPELPVFFIAAISAAMLIPGVASSPDARSVSTCARSRAISRIIASPSAVPVGPVVYGVAFGAVPELGVPSNGA